MSRVRLGRVYHFDALHRLRSPHLSAEANIAVYGKCGRAPGHGHRYRLTVVVEGEPDPVDGRVASKAQVDAAVRSALDELRGEGLVRVGDLCMGGMATGEHIVTWLARQLSATLTTSHCYVERIELEETCNNRFFWQRKDA